MSFYDDGVRFECTRCGHCCTCEGYVFITAADLGRLIENEGFELEELQKHYFSSYQGYTVLRDNSRGDCIFWDSEIKGCKIYKNRPTQCQTYPFWKINFKTKGDLNREYQECPGLGRGKLYTKEEIDKLLGTF